MNVIMRLVLAFEHSSECPVHVHASATYDSSSCRFSLPSTLILHPLLPCRPNTSPLSWYHGFPLTRRLSDPGSGELGYQGWMGWKDREEATLNSAEYLLPIDIYDLCARLGKQKKQENTVYANCWISDRSERMGKGKARGGGGGGRGHISWAPLRNPVVTL